MDSEPSQLTVYFDGSCALCRTEIGHYRRVDEKGALCFVDVSQAGAPVPEGVSRQQALARFHVRAGDGEMLSGAAAFAALWARLPRWRWAARIAAMPGVLTALEFGYRGFLPLRPHLSRLVARMQGLLARPEQVPRA